MIFTTCEGVYYNSEGVKTTKFLGLFQGCLQRSKWIVGYVIDILDRNIIYISQDANREEREERRRKEKARLIPWHCIRVTSLATHRAQINIHIEWKTQTSSLPKSMPDPSSERLPRSAFANWLPTSLSSRSFGLCREMSVEESQKSRDCSTLNSREAVGEWGEWGKWGDNEERCQAMSRSTWQAESHFKRSFN